MEELTLILDCNNKISIENLKKLNGILNIETNNYDCLTNLKIKYNNELVTIPDIINSFTNYPLIISFDKHSKNKLAGYQIFIKGLHCEECFKNIIKKLLLTEGVFFVSSYYDDSITDIELDIKYDSNMISEEEINNIVSLY